METYSALVAMVRSNRHAFHRATAENKERAMKPIVKTLLQRSLLTLGAIMVWAKALARGKADQQTQSTPETDQKTAGARQQEPNRKPH